MGIVGAVIGDIIGSKWEFNRPKDLDWKNTPLLSDGCYFTDDTVMSIACKYAIKNNIAFAEAYQKFGRLYPNAGYGGMFDSWLRDDNPKPYDSFGNGSAMRVSYVGQHCSLFDVVEGLAKRSAECTHNHPEGIKGAVATAEAIWMAKHGYSKFEIKDYIEEFHGYDLRKKLDDIRPIYHWDVTCQGTVPVGIICFLESNDYESCMRNVLSLRCDSDTMCAIAGGIAESFYGGTGLDDDQILEDYLDEFLREELKK
jgi:ADP-ribosylglycohydrolase